MSWGSPNSVGRWPERLSRLLPASAGKLWERLDTVRKRLGLGLGVSENKSLALLRPRPALAENSASVMPTLAAYAADWVKFSTWCRDRGVAALPATAAGYLAAVATNALTQTEDSGHW